MLARRISHQRCFLASSVWFLRFIIFIGWRSFSRLFLWMRDQSQMDLTTFIWERPPNSLIVLVFFYHMVTDVAMIHCHFVLSGSIWRSPCFCCWFLPGSFIIIFVSFKFIKISSVLFPPTPQLSVKLCYLFLLPSSEVKFNQTHLTLPVWVGVTGFFGRDPG